MPNAYYLVNVLIITWSSWQITGPITNATHLLMSCLSSQCYHCLKCNHFNYVRSGEYDTSTSMIHPPLWYIHLYDTSTSMIHPPLIHPPLWYIHLYDTSTSMTHPPLWYIHLYDTSTSMTHPPIWHIHLYDTSTSMIHPPLWYIHFISYFSTNSYILLQFY